MSYRISSAHFAEKSCEVVPGKMQSPVVDQKHSRPLARHHNSWLLVIGVLKLLKSVLFVLIGIGAIHLLHKDVVDLFSRALSDLNFDPESHFVNAVLDKVALLNDHRIRLISSAIFTYATIDVIEGVGLLLEKAWAEYLTIILTASFLPWEMFEVLRHPTWVKFSLFVGNAVVVAYLLTDVRRHAQANEQLENLERESSQEL